jgi:hypothetical protein
MKSRLKACMEAAWDQAELEALDPSVLCRKMQEVGLLLTLLALSS